MNFFSKFLPIPEGSDFIAWAPRWLLEVAPDLRKSPDDPVLAGEHMLKLSSYLSTLTTMRSVYEQQIDDKKRQFKQDNPRGSDEQITAYKERVAEHVAPLNRMADFLRRTHEDVSQLCTSYQSFGKNFHRERNTPGA